MPKRIWVWVVGEDAPQKGEAPSLWTAELQQAASGPVVKRQLSVWPWKADGKYAKAVDIWGKTWQAKAAMWNAPVTKAVLGEEAFRKTRIGKRKRVRPTMAGAGEEAYRQTPHGQRKATESARLLAARGAGETEDGLTEGEREALAAHVAADVSGYVNHELTDDPNAVGYVAVGTRERMVSNLEASKANEWKHLGNCEIFGSLLRTNAAAFVIVEGTAQRFTTAFIRKVCAEPSLHPAPHVGQPSGNAAPPPVLSPLLTSYTRAWRMGTSRPLSARSTWTRRTRPRSPR